MAIHWIKPDIAECTRRGVAYFTSELEMISGLPCKIYRITEEFGSLSDHMHDYFQIWYISRGEFDHTLFGQKYRMTQGSIFVLPPYSVHRVEMLPGKELEVLGCEFMPEFINEHLHARTEQSGGFDQAFIESFMVPEDKIPLKIMLSSNSDLAVRELMTEMLAEFGRRGPRFELLLKANLLKLLGILSRELEENGAGGLTGPNNQYREPIMESIEFIHNHYDKPLSLQELCAVTMMSRTNFCRHFKEVTGRTFSQYVTNYRIRMAMRLLAQPELTVTEVCYKVGFNELPYFCRVFKKYTGTTPAYYKKNAY
ncbi:AraC family transcriptional regulator [Paenibacillus ihbetae]|uniref:AraC family transcriptional regulator n=1 Tax=Paenibacillus ihbetae TaxID=1870820 RepID=A0A1B2DZN9_9BACL|nr:AraC family transcriptional regulator [Paenibacillus ihbetae]ANY73185.1 AraC family transcriptional regulator [Paenibacillus ihbetae]